MNIITLTLNPALDKSAKVDQVIPDQKLKCHSIQYQAGGGGVNISRVLNVLQVKNKCICTIGGDTGLNLKNHLLKENINLTAISVEAWTRENLSIVDKQTQLQYRFGMPGGELSLNEIEQIKTIINNEASENSILVLSGSISEKMPLDLYVKIIQMVKEKNIKIIVDTSEKALMETLKENVFLIKPNQKELAQLAGKEFLTKKEQEVFAMELVNSNRAKYVVVSLGARGAFLASSEGVFYKNTPSVKVKSTIGAGDSMVAGMVFAIQNGFSSEEILKWGVVCGTATTMSEGTNLASKKNINTVLELMG
ncbi:1-phosphofructokinase family hexose kinase [Lutibacter sp. TH_r2]|uniref:1-phosphofructokinase family hexose kinase n=1 Tax=Lutibacter sp. TH_r2 TaxID=3082083 RepID=UPI00295487E8|nr:1-phosphofructokinase family hexose kinase [Lutibacter sp. TH_r2]MDV7188314.1 1-phosphofructokinase family hexose kinase [Lutibacter sp. TH_r2]